MQFGLFTDDLAWKAPTHYPRLHGPIGLDLETRDAYFTSHGPGWPFGGGSEIVGISIAGPDWQDYWPIAHEGGGNLPASNVLNWLHDELERNPDPTLELRGYNWLHDGGFLRKPGHGHGGIRPRCKIFDSLTAVPLIDENRFSYQLERVAADYLGAHKLGKGLGSLEEATKFYRVDGWKTRGKGKGNLYQLPAAAVAPYASQDARLHYDLPDALVPHLNKDDLWQIFQLETDLVPVLLDMRERGVPVNVDRAERSGKLFRKKSDDLVAEIYRLTGVRVSLWVGESVAAALATEGIKCPKTPKSEDDSVQAKWLEGLAATSQVANLLLRARRYDYAERVFIKGSILAHVVDGLIHCQFSPLRSDEGGAVTGRFSSSNPNLQNQSARKDEDDVREKPLVAEQDEMALEIRGCFEPWPGDRWAAVDWSAQEPRTMVHFASVSHTRGADKAVAAYRENPRLDFHKFGAQVTGLPRKKAKNITLGRMYEMGGAKLCHSLGLPTIWVESKRQPGKMVEIAGPEGQKILDQYDENMPFVKLISRKAIERAEARGYIKTLLGRRRRFRMKDGTNPRGAFTYKALNCLIQGSAADMMKKAMIDLYREGIVPLVTVHDELGISFGEESEARHVKEVMLNCVKLEVPLEADIEIGPNWGEATKGLV